MRRVRLGDVCRIVSGSTPKSGNPDFWGGAIPWVTPAELDDESHWVFRTDRYLTETGFDSASLHMMPIGTVLLSTRAPIGKTAIAGVEMCCNQGFKNLVCGDEIDCEYLYRFLKSNTSMLQALGRGATFKELSKREIERFEIPLPPLERQRECTSRLDAIDNEIARARTLSMALDELVKSRFVEMFGAVDDARELQELILPKTKITYGIVQPGPEGTGDMGVLRPVDIVDGHLNLKSVKRIDRSIGNSYKRTELSGDEVLTVVRGATGQTIRSTPEAAGMNVTRGIAVIRYDAALIDPDYLVAFMNSDDGRRYIAEHTQGATLQQINIADLKAMSILMPPLSLQQEFSAFVQQVDKLKFDALLAIGWPERLYDRLAWECFAIE